MINPNFGLLLFREPYFGFWDAVSRVRNVCRNSNTMLIYEATEGERGIFAVYALRDIKKGENITACFNRDLLLRDTIDENVFIKTEQESFCSCVCSNCEDMKSMIRAKAIMSDIPG
jgi:SET domain-containing protein